MSTTGKWIMQLIRQDRKFFLMGALGRPSGKSWKQALNGNYITEDILDAARFRKYADPRTENYLKKLLLTDVPFPACGIISPIGETLFPFQRDRGIPHILKTNRTYLAHEPGLGKSAQSICAVASKPGKTLIICPGFLKINWARQITRWFRRDFPSIEIVPDTAQKLKMNWEADFIICSDTMLIKEWVRTGLLKTNFRYTFVDEGHRFKNHEAFRTIALFGGLFNKVKVPGLIYNSEHVTFLSGTPMLNRPIELWSVLYGMAPELIDFMSYSDFGFRYCGATQNEYGHWQFLGASNQEELKKRIMGRFMQRIKKSDVLSELPDKIRKVLYIAGDMRSKEIIDMDRKLTKKLSLKGFDKNTELFEYALLRHENGKAKIDWTADYISNLLISNPNEQIILFAHHRDVIDSIKQKLLVFNPAVINGATKQHLRVLYEDQFQKQKLRLIIGNIDSMNLGLTLTAATRIVFAEYSWTPELNKQAEDRAHRIGQKNTILCEYLVISNSIDEVILNSLIQKEDRIERIIG